MSKLVCYSDDTEKRMNMAPRSLALPLILFLASSSASANLCAPPAIDENNNYGYDLSGIGDGCTLKGTYDGVELDASYIADIATFKDMFTPSCNYHDKCLTQIGSSRDQCNSEFYQLLRNACDDQFKPLLPRLPLMPPPPPNPLNILCRDVAFKYFTAVKNFTTDAAHRNFQRASQAAARKVAFDMSTGVCATTPEKTGLYNPQFLSQSLQTFQEIAGRAPTPFEFFDISSSLDLSSSEQWTPAVVAWASYDRQFTPPDASFVVNRSWSGLSLTAQAVGVEYLWVVNGIRSNEQTLQLTLGMPMYDTNYRITGFLKTTANGRSNLSLVDLSIRVRGECASRRGQACR